MRTVQIRIAGNPHEPEAGDEAQAAALREFLTDPSRAESRFEEWIAAGADVLLAPSLRATPARLKPLGLAQETVALNRVQLEALRRLAGRASPSPWVAAQVGTLGPAWEARDGAAFYSFDEAYIHYHEQSKAIALAQPDLVLVRGIEDLRLLRAAMVAIRELYSGLLMVLLGPGAVSTAACASPGTRPRGADPLEALGSAAEVVASLGAQGIGIEGRLDPARVESLARSLRSLGFRALGSALPAGQPALQGIASLARSGVDLALLEGEKGLEALRLLENRGAVFTHLGSAGPASLAPGVSLDAEPKAPEPATRELLVALEVALEARDPGASARELAHRPRASAPGAGTHSGIRILSTSDQLAAGGMRRRRLEERLSALEAEQGRPVAVVVRDPLVLETCLKALRGRSIAYLDSLDPSLWQSVLYLAAKYGAKLGVRLEPARVRPGEPGGGACIPPIVRLLEAAHEYGIAPSELYVDLLGPEAWETSRPALIEGVLRQMPRAKRETGVRWILGCHHFRDEVGRDEIGREKVGREEAAGQLPPSLISQSEILSIALFQGLDAVILGEDQPHLVEVLRSGLKPALHPAAQG